MNSPCAESHMGSKLVGEGNICTPEHDEHFTTPWLLPTTYFNLNHNSADHRYYAPSRFASMQEGCTTERGYFSTMGPLQTLFIQSNTPEG